MEKRLERIKKHLHSQSYKLTPQREATVRVLLEHEPVGTFTTSPLQTYK